MKIIIPIICIFGSHAFFVFFALFGLTYLGENSSGVYKYFTIIISITSVLFFLIDFAKFNRKIHYLILLIPGFIALSYLFSFFISGSSQFSNMFFTYYLLWSLPAFLIGVYFTVEGRVVYLIKSLDIVMLMSSIAAIVSVLANVLQGSYSSGIGGATNQTLSYIAAFAFGLNLFLNFTNIKIQRFQFVHLTIYKVLSTVFLPLTALSVFIVGGRGASVLVLVYILTYVLLFFINLHLIKFKKIIFTLVVSVLPFIQFSKNEIVQNGFNRAFSYIESGAIQWNQTSNREIVYQQAINLILDQPLLGYGPFGYFTHMDNPHNIILEILLSGGIVYLITFSIVSILIFFKFLKLVRQDLKIFYLGVLALFPLTMLLFSGTYLVSSELWFFFGFIISFRIKQINKELVIQ
ncbi:O-antigen ligase family protein [Planococcus sp. 11815]|uniref:O-antigen ligase family protein n=1 Tax=Planococcus sp. 11815 TaxID=2939413 RepID=UPI003DA3DEF6